MSRCKTNPEDIQPLRTTPIVMLRYKSSMTWILTLSYNENSSLK